MLSLNDETEGFITKPERNFLAKEKDMSNTAEKIKEIDGAGEIEKVETKKELKKDSKPKRTKKGSKKVVQKKDSKKGSKTKAKEKGLKKEEPKVDKVEIKEDPKETVKTVETVVEENIKEEPKVETPKKIKKKISRGEVRHILSPSRNGKIQQRLKGTSTGKNQWGHKLGSQAAKIDHLIDAGRFSLTEIQALCGARTKGRLYNHFRSLKTKGFPVINEKGKLKFA